MIDLSSGTAVLTLVCGAALLMAAVLALERAGVLRHPDWVLAPLVLAVSVLLFFHLDHTRGTEQLQSVTAFLLNLVMLFLWFNLTCAREDRGRNAEVFAIIAPAINGKVVASHRLEGRWSTSTVEVILTGPSGLHGEYPASHLVRLHVPSGGCAWSVRHGRLPGTWRSKGWHVESRDPAVVERLELLGAPTLVARRYCRLERPFSAEIESPLVLYDPDRGRLDYFVRVVEGRMASLTIEQFTAQLELLRRMAELDREANPATR